MPYAFLDANGVPVEILPDLAFATPKLKVAADEAEHYEVAAGAVIDQLVNHPSGSVMAYEAEDRDRYLIQSFDEPARPAGKVVEARTLVVVDGVISVAVTFAYPPLPEVQAKQLAAAAAAYDERRQSPMAWDFGATVANDDLGVSQGAAGTQQLQMRDTPSSDDLKNWIAVAALASVLQMSGHGATILPLKTAANVWVQTTATQVLQVLATGDGTQTPAFARGLVMLEHYGALKRQISDATDAEAVLAIDVTAGWPA